jgi:hypothetical protein
MELSSDFTVYAVIWIVGCVVIAAGIVALLVGLVIDGVKRRQRDELVRRDR